MRQPRERSRLIYVYDFHLKSGLRRFAHDEVDLEGATPVVITDPCATHGPDYSTGSEDDVATTPTESPDCSTTIDPTDDTVDYQAGTGSITVESACLWDAVSTVSWLTVTSATGRGNGTVEYAYTENTNGIRGRVGKILIGDQVFTLTQGLQCRYNIAPTFVRLNYNAQNSAFFLQAGPTCDWTAAINGDWISIIDDPTYGSAESGTGPALIKFHVDSNRIPLIPAPSRIGTITIEDKIFVVYQSGTIDAPTAGATCSIDVDPASESVPLEGGEFSADVTTSGATCPWVVIPSEDWIHIVTGGVGMGNAEFTYSVDENTGEERTALIRVTLLDGNGVDLVVTQDEAVVATPFVLPAFMQPSWFLSTPVGDDPFIDLRFGRGQGSDSTDVDYVLPCDARLTKMIFSVGAFVTDVTAVSLELYVDGVATGAVVTVSTPGTPVAATVDVSITQGQHVALKIDGTFGSDPELDNVHLHLIFEAATPFVAGFAGAGGTDPFYTTLEGYALLVGTPPDDPSDPTSASGVVPADLVISRLSNSTIAFSATTTLSIYKNGSNAGSTLTHTDSDYHAADQAVTVDAADAIGLHLTHSSGFGWIIFPMVSYLFADPHGTASMHTMTFSKRNSTAYFDLTGSPTAGAAEADVEMPYGIAGTFTLLSVAHPDRGSPGGTYTVRLKSGAAVLLEAVVGSGITQDSGTGHIAATDDAHWEVVGDADDFINTLVVAVLFIPD
jgi:hypothetical protein